MTTLFEDPHRGPVELAGSQLRSYDFSFRRLTDLGRPCPVCNQPKHYRCRDPQHPWNFTDTHPERLPGGQGRSTGDRNGSGPAGGADSPESAAAGDGTNPREGKRFGHRWG